MFKVPTTKHLLFISLLDNKRGFQLQASTAQLLLSSSYVTRQEIIKDHLVWAFGTQRTRVPQPGEKTSESLKRSAFAFRRREGQGNAQCPPKTRRSGPQKAVTPNHIPLITITNINMQDNFSMISFCSHRNQAEAFTDIGTVCISLESECRILMERNTFHHKYSELLQHFLRT